MSFIISFMAPRTPGWASACSTRWMPASECKGRRGQAGGRSRGACAALLHGGGTAQAGGMLQAVRSRHAATPAPMRPLPRLTCRPAQQGPPPELHTADEHARAAVAEVEAGRDDGQQAEHGYEQHRGDALAALAQRQAGPGHERRHLRRAVPAQRGRRRAAPGGRRSGGAAPASRACCGVWRAHGRQAGAQAARGLRALGQALYTGHSHKESEALQHRIVAAYGRRRLLRLVAGWYSLHGGCWGLAAASGSQGRAC